MLHYVLTLPSYNALTHVGKHTIFGRVSRGMEIIKRLGSVQTDNNDRYGFICYFDLLHLSTFEALDLAYFQSPT